MLIGRELADASIVDSLDDCLASDDERANGAFENPFPETPLDELEIVDGERRFRRIEPEQ